MRIVITGVGIVAPNGIGKEEFWDNCFAGVSGVGPITLFDTCRYRCHSAGEVRSFTPEDHLGSKGLRTLDRTTRLALVAAKLALEDAQCEVTPANGKDVGVVLGSTMGSLHSISQFDMVGLRDGPRYVNPALFPNVVINSPASQVSIRFKLRGLSSTISTGFTAGLDAIGYALHLLQLGRVKAMVVGGVEELCLQTFLGFYRLGLLAAQENGSPSGDALPPARRRGTLLGEGAAVFVLEPLEEARRRNIRAYAELLGYSTAFHPDSMHRYDPSAAAAVKALRQVLHDTELRPEAIDYVGACASSTRAIDAMERTAITRVFGAHPSHLSVSAVKSMLGESFSAAAALQLAVAVGAIVRQQVPPTVRWEAGDAEIKRHVVPHQARSTRVETALVPSISLTGISSALVVRGHGDA